MAMAGELASNINNVERLRQDLESSLAKLRKTLQYWQTWEAEYEGFQEELEALGSEPSQDEMVSLALDYGGTVMNEKEIKDIVAYNNKQTYRSKKQIINVLSARIETGRKNAETIQAQINKAELELEQTASENSVAIKNESGDPLMEIMEELDDDGNVISSTVENFDRAIGQVQDLIERRKAKDFQSSKSGRSSNDSVADGPKQNFPKPGSSGKSPSRTTPASAVDKSAIKSSERDTGARKATNGKGVFNEPTSETVESDSDNYSESIISLPEPHYSVDELSTREEFQENIRDIGPVVATMDLGDEDWSGDDIDYNSDEYEAEENDYGMTNIRDEMDDDYIKQMEALMKKHSLSMQNVGRSYNSDSSKVPEKATKGPAIKSANSEVAPKKDNSKKSASKGVRFAEELDISPAPPLAQVPDTSTGNTSLARSTQNPLTDAVVERKPKAISQPISSPAEKQSQFKTNLTKQSARTKVTTNPTSKIGTAKKIVTTKDLSLKEEFEAFNKRMTGSEARLDQHVPQVKEITEEEEERPVKMSKFMAARLGYS